MTIAFAVLSLLVAAFEDLRCRLIPDTCSLIITACGLWMRASGDGSELSMAVFAALAVFTVMVFLFYLGAVGGGDVKLLPASTLLFPTQEVPTLLVLVSFAGGILAVVAIVRRALRGSRLGTRRGARDRAAADGFGFQGEGVPYGVAILAGVLANLALHA